MWGEISHLIHHIALPGLHRLTPISESKMHIVQLQTSPKSVIVSTQFKYPKSLLRLKVTLDYNSLGRKKKQIPYLKHLIITENTMSFQKRGIGGIVRKY